MNKVANFVIAAATTVAAVAPAAAFAQELRGDLKDQAEEILRGMLMNQRLVARTTFPAWKDGIDLGINGTWDQGKATRRIKDRGVGIAVDEVATVTDVKLKNEHIEIHLNGGGFGTFGDHLLNDTSRHGDEERETGGSRINLRFERRIRMEDVDAGLLAAWLDPVVDASSLQQQAALADLPPEFAEAAARGEIIEGMDKQTVFAILGEPAERHVDLEQSPPLERWQYDLGAMQIMVVTISGGVVTKVEVI